MNALIRNLTCLSLLLASAAARCETAEPSSAAEATARTFYAWVLAHPSAGLPTPEQLAELQPLLSPQLHASLQAAATAEADCERSTAAGDKPLMIEGDLFVGLYEGASEVALGAATVDGELADVPATLIHLDTRFERTHPHRLFVWQDRLQLARAAGRWQVVDIHPGTGDSLQATLDSFIALADRECRKSR